MRGSRIFLPEVAKDDPPAGELQRVGSHGWRRIAATGVRVKSSIASTIPLACWSPVKSARSDSCTTLLAGYQAVERFLHPQPLAHLGWVLAAGLVGFAGNELVAFYRIRVGRRIGSAALVADGIHARTDGFTSLAVVLGVLGVWAGFPMADPIIGLLISLAILALLIGTARDIGHRLLDGVDPALVDQAQQVVESVPGITTVNPSAHAMDRAPAQRGSHRHQRPRHARR